MIVYSVARIMADPPCDFLIISFIFLLCVLLSNFRWP